jgi:hypothetical protein
MVNWKKEIENNKNTINISFIDYDNIKFYTMKDLDEHFNKNKDNTNDNEYYNYINNKYKKEEKKKEKEEEEGNKNISNINKNKFIKNNYNKNKYNNLFVYYYTYLNKKIIFSSPNFTNQILKTLIL